MSIVAHDLKSPMNRIFALSRILEMEGGLTNDQLNYLKLVKETTNSGIDLITDLLDVTALEESSLNAAIAPVNLQELVRTKAELLQTAAAAKNITISILNEVTKEINTDRDYLGRILDNLVSNAIKFSAANSHVFTKLWVEKSSLMLSVKDEGPGFSDYDKRNLYQKFKKLTARPTGGESSNGLGLAIVKTLVDRLNGQIELISEVGTGSEFIVKIPII